MPLIETFGLSRRFEEKVAGDDLNLTVETGEVLGLLGPNKGAEGGPLKAKPESRAGSRWRGLLFPAVVKFPRFWSTTGPRAVGRTKLGRRKASLARQIGQGLAQVSGPENGQVSRA